ncbi:MAG: hypothetical protein ABW164_07460 [Sphingobium sp.]
MTMVKASPDAPAALEAVPTTPAKAAIANDQRLRPTSDTPIPGFAASSTAVAPMPAVVPAQRSASEASEPVRAPQAALPLSKAQPASVRVAGETIDALIHPTGVQAVGEAPPVDISLIAGEPDPANLPDNALASDIAAAAKPAQAKFEALSLLQWTRDHVSERPVSHSGANTESVVRVADAAPTGSTNEPVASPTAGAPVLLLASSTPPVSTPSPITPVPDVAATIGATIVDMGVGGQWIDRLARDIAGFAADGAQGSFWIEAGALGPIGVAISRTGDGAVIALQVASDAVEAALRQDGDLLRQDAALSAVRIADLRIERAPHADAPRGETMNREGGQQQGRADHQGSAMGQQGAGQSAGRQTRENSAFSAKAGGDRAVLDDGQAHDRASDAPRARFA